MNRRFQIPKTRAVFRVAKVESGFVFIIDEANERGTMSVTNDAESVVAGLHTQFPNHRIIYKDTDGRWDELDHEAGQFRGFKPLPPCFTVNL